MVFDREYRAYGQSIADVIRRARSHAKVETVDSGPLLEEAVHRSGPYLVVCNETVPDNSIVSMSAWIKPFTDPQESSRIRFGDYL